MGSLGEFLCLKTCSLMCELMAAMVVEVPTLVQRLRKEHLLVQSSADPAVFQEHQCHEASEFVDILGAQWNI